MFFRSLVLIILFTSFNSPPIWGIELKNFKIKSSSFLEGGNIPNIYTCESENISPKLIWSGNPEGTKSFVLIVTDPDAPSGTWTHWTIYNIPPESMSLSKNMPKIGGLEDGIKQGENSFKDIGYGGPCPPKGMAHRYYFKLYALDKELDLPGGVKKIKLLKAMKGHVLGYAKTMGKFKR